MATCITRFRYTHLGITAIKDAPRRMVGRRVLAACTVVLIATSCGSDPLAGPTLAELQGEWRMSWMESGSGLSCTWSDVVLSLRDSAKGQSGIWGGGRGSCAGLIASENLVLLNFVVDSLTVEDGRIRFVPRSSTYRFVGRVTSDEMNGTMSASPFLVEAGVRVQTTGAWRAVREPTP
jgi:hypothetical protein